MAAALRLKPYGLNRWIFSTSTTSTISGRCRVAAVRTYSTSDRLPKIADTSVWTAMIPTFMRRKRSRTAGEKKKWNPATFYIVMFTLIGSQAIRMLTLKNNYTAYRRTVDAKIELLKEVIKRVQNGEDVDVEKLLGTGDEAKEREWEEVLQEIQREDNLWHEKHKSTQQPENNTPKIEDKAAPKWKEKETVPATNEGEETTQTKPTRKPTFF
ncbi:uncharacterized protein N7443_004042 [Penicillium atrosanguineum]|uniref:Uncharacterized protein n=1 Tax=Penicillium atrosanguineum TaxID=1132637 RepID=A0A9W9U7M9_9EURO|nr:uncharacterized protein N7443_004042 [Penicillium atrosanguineum]KAJ5304382.1 hypothetical protein N7443_004042 [Penicillium atrosanguineum]KAJ5323855.1 hypothetical protein N7476_002455 [Penicillium atrosanguineum]